MSGDVLKSINVLCRRTIEIEADGLSLFWRHSAEENSHVVAKIRRQVLARLHHLTFRICSCEHLPFG